MDRVAGPVSTRHLVDPEIDAPLDLFPSFQFSPKTLPAIREGMIQAGAATPVREDLLRDILRQELFAPGLEGEPHVRVLHYRPRAVDGIAPALLWIHGGGFVLGTADDDDATCRQLAKDTGAVVLSVDYRLAPETPAPGSVSDCYAALTFLHDQADSLDVDRSRIAIGGTSAGGGLAACLAILARDRGLVSIGFQLLVYPMLDDRTAVVTPAHPYAGEFIWTPNDNRFGWGALLGERAGGQDVSPYAAAARVEDLAGLPPTFVCVGSLDLFAMEDLTYAGRLLEAGVPVELHVYPGGYHGFNMVPEAWLTQAYSRDSVAALNRFFIRPSKRVLS